MRFIGNRRPNNTTKTPPVFPPVINDIGNIIFSVLLPATNNQVIGTLGSTYGPATFSLVQGSNPNTNFAVSTSGIVTITANGVTNLTANGTVTLQIYATNKVGISNIFFQVINYTTTSSFITIFNQANTNTNDSGGDQSGNFRMLFPTDSFTFANSIVGTQGKILVTWGNNCPTIANCMLNMYVGQQNTLATTSGPSFRGDQVPVTFSGAQTLSSSLGTTVTSDVFTLAQNWDNTSPYIVSMYFGNFPTFTVNQVHVSNAILSFNVNAVNESGVTTPTETYSTGNNDWFVTGIEIFGVANTFPAPLPLLVNLLIPEPLGTVVGTANSPNLPTSWSLSGTGATNFTIFSNGQIIVNANGASGLTSTTYNLTATATNSSGSGSNTVTIVANTLHIPVINNASFTFAVPATLNEIVGLVVANTNIWDIPTGWVITAGNASNNYGITPSGNSGQIFVTANGVTNLTANGTASLTVVANNAAGNSASATISLTFISGGGSGTLPSGVTLQAIDGETMLTATTMSNNYYTSHGYTFVTNNPSYPGVNWDNPATFPICNFFGVYQADIPTFQSLKFNNPNTTNFSGTSIAVTGVADWGNGAGNFTPLITASIFGFPSEGDIPSSSWGNWTPGFHVDDNVSLPSDLQGYINGYGAAVNNRIFSQVLSHNFITAPGLGAQNSVQLLSSNNFVKPGGGTLGIGIIGADFYWFAVSQDVTGNASGAFQAGGMLAIPMATGGTPNATTDQMARGSNYGNMIDVYRSFGNGTNPGPGSSAFGTSYAPSKIVSNAYIETLNGLWTEESIVILPAQYNWASWSSIIHGVRLITYFTNTSTAHGQGYSPSMATQAIATNTLIDNLARIINSPFAKGYVSSVSPHGYIFPVYEQNWLNGGIEVCVHWYQGGTYTPASGPLSGVNLTNGFYIFSDTRYGGSQAFPVTATYTINDPNATSAVLIFSTDSDQGNTYTISGGSFSVSFTSASSVKIFQVIG